MAFAIALELVLHREKTCGTENLASSGAAQT
jgi:hypothetical protein